MTPNHGTGPTKNFFGKNTIDLQWKMRANYNASLCASLRKAAGAGTMENNAKNNALSNRNSRKTGRRRCARVAAAWDAAVRHHGDAPEAMKKPADEQRRATVAQIRD
jgi:hypothetical protein